ncbi:MAG TPA: twin-arginine translocase subunit TatC [Dehalococcoidia bacterium]|nr:twin-arginine translocase subunit TatC [Dehalococcoidia bacterium]
MTIIEHLEELRRRVFISCISIVIGLGISAVFGKQILEFLKQPAEDKNPAFSLQYIEPFELIVTYFRVALLGGLIFAMPMVIYQALMYVSPALTPKEKRWVYGTVIGAFGFFIGGMAFCYYVALPPALNFLLNFGNDIAAPNIRIGSYVDFVTRLIFWTGVTFETPLVVMYLARFRILSSGQALRFWRYAVVLAFAIAAVVTPTIDPVTQSIVAGPIIVLYFLGIVLAWIVEPKSPT